MSADAMARAATPDQLQDWQGAANHHVIRSSLRGAAVGSLLFGALAIAMGASGLDENPANAVLLGIGLFLVVEGIWLVLAPVRAGFVVDGIAMCMVGTWNVIVGIANANPATSFVVMLGLYQLFMGSKSFGRFRRLAAPGARRPSAEALARIETLVGEVSNADPRTASDVIAFQAKSFWDFSPQRWKGRLGAGIATFVASSPTDVVLTEPASVEIAEEGKEFLGNEVKAYFRLGAHRFRGTISPDSLARYHAWREGAAGVVSAPVTTLLAGTPTAGTGAAARADEASPSLASLMGVAPGPVLWRRVWLFVAASAAVRLLSTLMLGGRNLGGLAYGLLLAGCALLAFRLLSRPWSAVPAAAVVFGIASEPLARLFGAMGMGFVGGLPGLLLRLASSALVLGGLVVALDHLRPPWKALFAGHAAGALLAMVTSYAVHLAFFGSGFLYPGMLLKNVVVTLVLAAAFATILGAGLRPARR